ncbi:MAG: cryptochrome/photolyase family protein [Pseudomonadales bacterium]
MAADRQPKKVLRLVLGDQLDAHHSWFTQVDQNVLYVIAELVQEQRYVQHHIQKTVAFFLAMERFADRLEREGHRVHHYNLDQTAQFLSLTEFLAHCVQAHEIDRVEYQLPDEYRLRQQLASWQPARVEVKAVESEHFYLTEQGLKKQFKAGSAHRLEPFYRKMRQSFNVLMKDGSPVGGQWNFDKHNQKALPKTVVIPAPFLFQNSVSTIQARLDRHGIKTLGQIGSHLIWPVDEVQAEALLADFCLRLLPNFGRYQDAMTSRGWSLFHSRLSFALNSKILSPKRVVDAAVAAFEQVDSSVGCAEVEGFVRQILGWREFVRGIYWANMPDYAERNVLNAEMDLPSFYWTGDTRMACLKQAIDQSLEHGYAHHIQRLMITGNFALMLGVDPKQVDAWYLGIYVDAIEWVEMPNTRGMSQFADGGLVASKPYISSGKYIQRMSDHCRTCAYDVTARTGEMACPYNVLYWDFLDRHRARFGPNPRMRLMMNHYEKIPVLERDQIRSAAQTLRQQLA